MNKKIIFILASLILCIILVAGCGYVTEEEILPKYYNDTTSPFIINIDPYDGSKLNSLSQIDITYSEDMVGADIVSNYSLSGSGIGSLEIVGISLISTNQYRLSIDGTPADGEIILNINNVTDMNGNNLAGNQVNYIGDVSGPTISATPSDGSKIDSLNQIDIKYSEEVSGADALSNYTLSGSGLGSLSLSSVTSIGNNTYRLSLTGTPLNGNITVTINNVTDTVGNALSNNTITYTWWWDTNWSYRIPITISGASSDLTDYQIAINIDNTNVEFWNNVEIDGRSIRFIDTDGHTELNFWWEKFDYYNESAIIWVKVPSIQANTSETIHLYYSNTGATIASNGSNTFVFFDDLEDGDASDWTIYQSGGVQFSPDPKAIAGVSSNYSLEKINNSDPNGGWKSIQSSIGLGYIFEGRIYRPSSYSGGSADRLAIENSSYNGYGFLVNHSGSGTWSIERRTNGSGTTLGSSGTSYNPPEDSWYKFSFWMKPGGNFDVFFYDIDGNLMNSVTNINDSNYQSFDIVIIHGGYNYFIDDMRIRKYANPEPSAVLGSQESLL